MRARSDERAALDRHAGALHDLGDRQDVGGHGSRRAVGLDRQAAFANGARETLDVGDDVRARAGKPDVRRVDPEGVHAPQDVDLLVDARHPDRGRLQAIPQRLIVQHDARTGQAVRRGVPIPVVNQRVIEVAGHVVACVRWADDRVRFEAAGLATRASECRRRRREPNGNRGRSRAASSRPAAETAPTPGPTAPPRGRTGGRQVPAPD